MLDTNLTHELASVLTPLPWTFEKIVQPPLAATKLEAALQSASEDILAFFDNDKASSFEAFFGAHSFARAKKLVDRHNRGGDNDIYSSLNTRLHVVDSISGVATGAYHENSNTILIAKDFIKNSSLDEITGVITEEIGHAIDNLVNSKDSHGDEGEAFALMVAGRDQKTSQSGPRKDNDRGFAAIGNQIISVEFNGAVTLFEHAEYLGRSKSFGLGSYAFIGSDFNDIATSIRIPNGSDFIVELYEHPNFQGRSTVVTASQASIGADWSDPNWKVSHLNDTISSMRVRRRMSNEIVFYQHSNFQGLAHIGLTGNHKSVRFNDDYSSIDLPSGARIEVFEHSNYGGRSTSYSSDIYFLGSLNDQVSSYQAYRSSNRSEAFAVLIDRVKTLTPSQLNNAIRYFGIATNNGFARTFTGLASRFMSVVGLQSGLTMAQRGDTVNGVLQLMKYGKVPYTNISIWDRLSVQFQNNVINGLLAIHGEYPGGVRLRDYLK